MKITQEVTPDTTPLLGAKIIFTKHTERNKRSAGFRHNHVKPDTVYEVAGYSHYPNVGEGPQVRCEDGSLGDVLMSSMDYDIVSMPDKSYKFDPITITLETYQEAQHLINLCHGYDVATELTRILATQYAAVS